MVVFKDVNVQLLLKKAKRMIRPPIRLQKMIGVWYLRQMDKIFNTQGSYKGHKKWDELKPATIARRAAVGKAGKILQVTGHLKGSIKILINNPQKLRIGTNLIYAGVHNYGYKPRNIPQREFLFMTPTMELAFGKRVNRWMQLQLRGVA